VTAASRRVPRAAVTQARSYRILVPGALVALALLTGLVLVVAGGILLGAVPVQAGPRCPRRGYRWSRWR